MRRDGFGKARATMSMPKLLGSVIVFGALSVVLIAMLWWRYAVDEKLGYCQTPEQLIPA